MNTSSWRDHLPSRKIQQVIVLLLVAGGILLTYWLVKTYGPTKEASDGYLKVSLLNPDDVEGDDDYFKDSDGDGLYDWLEILWGLDPHNPDTDGDGVPDGKYLREKLAAKERERLGISVDESSLTASEKLSRSLSTAIIATQQTGRNMTEADREAMSENVADYIGDLTLGNQLYLRDKLTLVEDSKENSYTYQKKMTELFRKYPISTNDIRLIVQASKEPTEFQGELRSRSLKYQNYLKALSEMEVPRIIGARHTQLANNVSQITSAIENLMQPEPDELILLSAMVQLEKITEKTVEAIVKINTYFDIIADPSLFDEESSAKSA